MSLTTRPLPRPVLIHPTTMFDLLTFVDLRSAAYRAERIPHTRLHSRILFLRTGHGTYAKLQVAAGDDLRISRLTVYSADGTIVRTDDDLTVRSSYVFDVDTATETPIGGDIWWHGLTPAVHYLEAVDGAAFHEVAGVDEVSAAMLAVGDYRAERVPDTALHEQLLFCRTGTGWRAALLLDADDRLTVRRFIGFDPHGVLRVDRSDIAVPRGFALDVETGAVTAGGGDLSWMAEDVTHCFLTPVNGARICFPSFFRLGRYLRLLDQPAIRAALVYQDAAGTRAYPDWSRVERLCLWEFLYLRDSGRDLPMTGPPALIDDEYLHPHDARSVYLAHVAHSLWIDAHRVVPWRLSMAGPEQLSLLLDMRTLLAFRPQFGHRFDPMGVVTSWKPVYAYEFLTSEGHLTGDQLGTIRNVVAWCRAHLRHISVYKSPSDGGPFASQADQYEYLYGYRGWPLVERMITPLPGRGHVTHGCSGTCGFLAAVLRTVNIPVRLGFSYLDGLPHRRPEFLTVGRGLIHGDDPYTAPIRLGHNNVPIERIFVDIAQLASLIDQPVPRPGMTQAETATYNHDALLAGLAVEYRTEYLLHRRCRDRQSGATGPASLVWQALHDYYSDADIADIVAALDAAIADIAGGCSAIQEV